LTIKLAMAGVQALHVILSPSLIPRPGTAISHSPGPWTPASFIVWLATPKHPGDTQNGNTT
jgi:hypothetical protein